MASGARFSSGELAGVTGGTWLSEPPAGSAFFLNTDSRTVGPGEIFLALSGERFDGHDFIPAAVARHAGAVLLSRREALADPSPVPALLVQDVLKAYQALAACHRRRFPNLQVVGVTGSVGKTSTKEMLRAIGIAAFGPEAVLATEGNTNNHVGVPQNLLRLTPEIRFAVIEMGTNHFGEIAPLTAMAAPQVALVNAVAACHLEAFGDLDGVAREKCTIYQGLPENGTAVLPHECAGHEILLRAAQAYRVVEAGKGGAVTAELLEGGLDSSRVRLTFADGKKLEFVWGLAGAAQAANAANAAAAALACGIAPETIAAGLAGTKLPGKRMAREEANGAVWINDAYNANPASMAAALTLFPAGTHENLVLVLGDMLELGASEAPEHEALLERLATEFADAAARITVGPRFAAARKILAPAAAAAVESLPDAAAAEARLRKIVRPGMTVFLKSSNGVGLGKIRP